MLVSISVNSEADPYCDDDGCCNNETENYRIDDDFSSGKYVELEKAQEFNILYTLVLVQFYFEPVSDSYIEYSIPESPPPLSQRDFRSQIQTYIC